MYDKAVDKCPFGFDSFPDQCNTQEMCDKIASNDLFKLNIVMIDIRLKMYNKAVDDFLPAIKFDWFVTSKMIKKLLTAWYAEDNMLYFNKDSGNPVFS